MFFNNFCFDCCWNLIKEVIVDCCMQVLIKVGYEAGLRDPTLEGLSMSLLSDGPDITREHPRNAAKRRKFE